MPTVNSISDIIHDFMSDHPGVNLYLGAQIMPGCCSALVLSGFGSDGGKKVEEEELVNFIKKIEEKAATYYAYIIATMLLPRATKWRNVLLAAGWEEVQQVAKSNSYNSSVPLKVYVKSLRPMTQEEIEIKSAEYKKLQEENRKNGYEF